MFCRSGLVAVLLCCHKAPPGLKKNLLRTFEAWSPEYISKSGSVSRSQALFVLAWFHAVVQERRIFIPQVRNGVEVFVIIANWFNAVTVICCFSRFYVMG